MRANYSAGETVEDEVLGTSADLVGNIFELQMMYPSAKMLGRPKIFKTLVTVRTHLERLLRRHSRCTLTLVVWVARID